MRSNSIPHVRPPPPPPPLTTSRPVSALALRPSQGGAEGFSAWVDFLPIKNHLPFDLAPFVVFVFLCCLVLLPAGVSIPVGADKDFSTLGDQQREKETGGDLDTEIRDRFALVELIVL